MEYRRRLIPAILAKVIDERVYYKIRNEFYNAVEQIISESTWQIPCPAFL
jgi:hypothetical protein